MAQPRPGRTTATPGLADGHQQPGHRGPGPGQGLRPAADLARGRDRAQQAPHIGGSVRGEHIGAPDEGAVAVGEGDGHVTGEQSVVHVLLVRAGPGDRDDGAALAAQLFDHLAQWPSVAHHLVGEAREVGQRRVVHHDDPQPRTPGRVQHGLGPRVGAALGPQRARMQDDRVGHLQLPQPLAVPDQDAGAGQRRGQYCVEGGGPVARGLGSAREHRLGGLGAVVLDEQHGRRSHQAPGLGVRGVLLRREGAQRWAREAGARDAGSFGRADVVLDLVEGGGPRHRLRQLERAQRAVQHQGGRGASGTVRVRVRHGQCEVHAGAADPRAQPVAEGGVLPEQCHQRGHRLG